MSDGCRKENRMTCCGCPKLMECDRVGEDFKALIKMKEAYPDRYRKIVSKGKKRKKSAARLKVKR